jgi:plasmid stabilization system protein ParE
VAEIVYSPRVFEHLERAFEFLAETNPAAGLAAPAAIRSAVETLAAHPLIGRRAEGELRELVVSFGATGFIVLYRFVIQQNQVRILALRHQREVGYQP